jgi:protein-S-isoprenylcysteine O-methyltransferase Ste14
MYITLQQFLPIYFTVFFIVAVIYRNYIIKQKIGSTPITILNNPGPQYTIGRYFKLAPIITATVVIIFSFFNTYYPYLAPIFWINHPYITIFGISLLILSLLWITLAQSHMGTSWRIGIDTKKSTDLITTGLFRYSRNPVFLGIKLNLIGFFLVLPNALTLALLCFDWVLIDVQVTLEEDHMHTIHGETYANYCNHVRRWI